MSLLEQQLRKQAAAHGLAEYHPFEEDDTVEEKAEEAVRAEAAELATFAGLRDAAPEFTAAAAEDAFAEFLCPSVQRFSSAGELLEGLGTDRLKAELQRINLKCGGTPIERAERLWSTKGVRDAAELDRGLFAKRKEDRAGAETVKQGKGVQKGPLLPYQTRRPGQKKLPRR